MSNSHRSMRVSPDIAVHDRLRQGSDGIDPDGEPKLPAWPNDTRAMPNEIARSALFSVRNHRTPREPHMKAPIFAVGDL